MNKPRLALVGLAVTSALGMSAAPAQAQGGDSVTGITGPPSGGAYVFDAHSGPTGENPTGTVDRVDGPGRTTATVTCLAVTGTRAAIVVDIANLGAFATFYVEDNDGAGADRYALVAGDDCSLPAPTDVIWSLSDGDIEVVDARPFPTTKDQCKNGGWRTFGVFKNQGDCVSFVATGGKNPPAG